ncbi:hypothetical protein [Thermococcus camini]|uniref:Uncharacterized protein n=1 Tax=Thermococcus camini TaxID=2016373 RepID=A0A7G2D9U1_9EURY|nr:hypothetical protein [Thermococcus camini]CAD5243947.1 conserved membrane protein of unknown function [Thermococcus camini]
MRAWEKGVIMGARVIVFLGLISALSYGKTDQIYAAVTGFVSLFVPSFVRWVYSKPSRKIWPWVSPFYNDSIYALFAIFMAAHITFLNVPFLQLDLYNQFWKGADIPSHYLGGLVTWVIFNEVVLESSRTYNLHWSSLRIVSISLLALVLVGVAWEFFEVALQPDMPWLYESLRNKTQDVVMELLGFGTGILMVFKLEYPYSMKKPLENAPVGFGTTSVDILPQPDHVKE